MLLVHPAQLSIATNREGNLPLNLSKSKPNSSSTTVMGVTPFSQPHLILLDRGHDGVPAGFRLQPLPELTPVTFEFELESGLDLDSRLLSLLVAMLS